MSLPPTMPANPWTTTPALEGNPGRSLLGSLRKSIGRKRSNASQRSTNSANDETSAVPAFRGPVDLNPHAAHGSRRSHSPMANSSPATRRPDRPGMNAFTVPSNEPPPAYTPSPVSAHMPAARGFENPDSFNQVAELAAAESTPAVTRDAMNTPAGGEDPYSYLATFDTVLLIDDSGSMAGRSWRETSQAIAAIAPIITKYDADGVDIHFMNHRSRDPGDVPNGIVPGGYRGITEAVAIREIFTTVRPGGGTPTGTRLFNILQPYLKKLEREMEAGRDFKPLSLIVITDGVPSDDVETVMINVAQKLDRLEAAPFQVGVQFFQVGNEQGAKEALEELDDELGRHVNGIDQIRDIVDTVTWTGGLSSSEGGVGLTGEALLKCCMGSVVKRLDRRRASGDVSRTARR